MLRLPQPCCTSIPWYVSQSIRRRRKNKGRRRCCDLVRPFPRPLSRPALLVRKICNWRNPQRISAVLLDAPAQSRGRLPELFCGFSRDQFVEPVPYPTAASTAWTATIPIRLVTSSTCCIAHVSCGGVWMNLVLPESWGDLHIINAPMAGGGSATTTPDPFGAV